MWIFNTIYSRSCSDFYFCVGVCSFYLHGVWNTGQGHLVAISTITLRSLFFFFNVDIYTRKFVQDYACCKNVTLYDEVWTGLSSISLLFQGYIWISNVWLWRCLIGLVSRHWLGSNIFVFNPEPDIQHTVQCQRLFLTGKLIYQNIKSDMRSLFYLPCRCLLYTQMTNDCRKWWVSWGVPQVNGTRHTLWLVTK